MFQVLVLIQNLKQDFDFEVRRQEFVGPQVGSELRDQGGLGLLAALAVMMVYIMFRFQYKFALGALLALIHDVLIVLGFFSFFSLACLGFGYWWYFFSKRKSCLQDELSNTKVILSSLKSESKNGE